MKQVLILSFILTIFGVQDLFAKKQSFTSNNTEIKWTGKKIGGSHHGYIKVKDGFIDMSKQQIKDGQFTMDMNSITCVDLTNKTYNSKLVGHLKSDDFFSVEKYETATLKITKADKFVDNKAEVTANVTIKGVTHPITFVAEKHETGIHAKLLIDRSKYNVRYGSNSFFDNLGDKAIDDVFEIEVELNL
ncbi:YceI family protein [Halosquirtibacter xylanolyticus]|uniref:YceI family protein n=1 Tax=Halosquirtibacter xylanolyticus TaxID=3374599 RepID=UPI0037486ADA|nr:YceI family protein [Prolixibacteraceae bacterium]